MKKEDSLKAKLEMGDCQFHVVDGDEYYCKALNLPEGSEMKYTRVFCYGHYGGLNCESLEQKYGFRDK